MLRRYGFGDLAEVYDAGREWAEQAQGRLPPEALLGRAASGGPDATTLPHLNRMHALTLMVRRDLAQNRHHARALARLVAKADGRLQVEARRTQVQVVEQTERLSAGLRARLTAWSGGSR